MAAGSNISVLWMNYFFAVWYSSSTFFQFTTFHHAAT
jgi:hypothetical protein